MTPIEIHRLAGAIATLRPDWPAQSLQAFIQRNLAHRAYRDAAVALTACALDPDTSTPARVLEAGPWWTMAGTRDVPTARNDCPEHPYAALRVDAHTGQQSCAGCWANTHGTDGSPQPLRRRGTPPTDEQRAQIRGDIHRTRETPPAARAPLPDSPARDAARREVAAAVTASGTATPSTATGGLRGE